MSYNRDSSIQLCRMRSIRGTCRGFNAQHSLLEIHILKAILGQKRFPWGFQNLCNHYSCGNTPLPLALANYILKKKVVKWSWRKNHNGKSKLIKSKKNIMIGGFEGWDHKSKHKVIRKYYYLATTIIDSMNHDLHKHYEWLSINNVAQP